MADDTKKLQVDYNVINRRRFLKKSALGTAATVGAFSDLSANTSRQIKIKIIIPITTELPEEDTDSKEIAQIVSPSVEFQFENIEFGTASIESAYDVALCIPGILKVAEKAQRDGFDGVLISAMGDPGVQAARERLDIPVVGPGHLSMLYASELAYSFSIITVLENPAVRLKDSAKLLGLYDKLASVRWVDIPVLQLTDKEELLDGLISESVRAIEQDKAHSIILGCTGMSGVSRKLNEALLEKGYQIPVIYPVSVAIKYLETLIYLRLTQSRKSYMSPPNKERNIWDKLN